MTKIFQIFKFLLNFLINLLILAAIIILLVWAIWGIYPQVSVSKTAHFLADGWHLITGQSPNTPSQVTREQLKESEKQIQHFYKK